VRLKVEFTGFSTINLQRFGAQFTGTIANPGEVLQFFRKTKKTGGTTSSGDKDDNTLDDSMLEGGEDEVSSSASLHDRIHRLSEQVRHIYIRSIQFS
jgi:hypothetical protein